MNLVNFRYASDVENIETSLKLLEEIMTLLLRI